MAAQAYPYETGSHLLIASDRVEGTPVRGADGRKIGFIKRLMIHKRTGQVSYVVMNCGGFLGLGGEYRAVPWDALHYDTVIGAYKLTMSEDELRTALSSQTGEDFDWGERTPKPLIEAGQYSGRQWG